MISLLSPQTRAALAQSVLKVAAGAPWRSITLTQIAAEAGLALAECVGATPGDCLDCVEEALDRAMAEGDAVDMAGPARDRLFDLLMRRFEAMERSRAAFVEIDRAAERDPVLLAAQHARQVRAARWALALAGLEADGAAAAARAQGLALILAQARQAWRKDEAGDFAKTMASLDKALRQAEQTFGRFAGLGETDAFKS